MCHSLHVELSSATARGRWGSSSLSRAPCAPGTISAWPRAGVGVLEPFDRRSPRTPFSFSHVLLRVRPPCTTVASSTRRRTRCISSATGVVVPTQYSLQCTRLEPVVVPVEEAADTVCLNRATRSTTRSSHLQHVPRYNGVHVGEKYSGGGARHREAPSVDTRGTVSTDSRHDSISPSLSSGWRWQISQSVSLDSAFFLSVTSQYLCCRGLFIIISLLFFSTLTCRQVFHHLRST